MCTQNSSVSAERFIHSKVCSFGFFHCRLQQGQPLPMCPLSGCSVLLTISPIFRALLLCSHQTNSLRGPSGQAFILFLVSQYSQPKLKQQHSITLLLLSSSGVALPQLISGLLPQGVSVALTTHTPSLQLLEALIQLRCVSFTIRLGQPKAL